MALPPDLGWYRRRLAAMSVREVLHRVNRWLTAWVNRAGISTARQPPPANLACRAPTNLWAHPPSVDPGPYVAAAEAIAAGHIDIFALRPADLGQPPRWNRDPLTGIEAPLAFGPTLDYRNPELVGDIKYLWEPNRHLHLVTLAQAYRLSGELRHLEQLRVQLDSWFAACPYLRGPNWTSALELSIRLINWAFVWQLIGGLEAPIFQGSGSAFRDRWLTSVYQHADFVRRHDSRYSSANNHLIGEAAGLLVASVVWPHWGQRSETWRDWGMHTLSREALTQNAQDGVNREASTAYHLFVLDFLLIAAQAAEAVDQPFPAEYWRRIEAMLEFMAAVMDVAGHVPMIGDADDGYVVRLSQEDGFCPFRSVLATGAVRFARDDFKGKAARVDHKTLFLLGQGARASFDALEPPSDPTPRRRAFNSGGYYILGDKFEAADEVRLVADVGPLGYRSIAAHGHADALAFTLSVAGCELLIDPGTYAYHTKQPWRDYFRGTAAHNTVRIDGQNQSVMGGPFLWTFKADACCETWEPGDDQDRLVGRHDGYQRLDDPVSHRREVLLLKKERRIIVTDTLECAGRHQVEMFWHFGEECTVALDSSGRLQARVGEVSLALELEAPGAETQLYYGDEERPAGWVSRAFDIKEPTTTAVWRTEIKGTSHLRSEISYASRGG